MTVIIGIDPHKATHTAVAIDGDEQPHRAAGGGRGSAPDRSGCWRGRRRSATNGRGRSSPPTGSGKLLAQQLLAAGEHVVDVPADAVGTGAAARLDARREERPQRRAVDRDRRAAPLRAARGAASRITPRCCGCWSTATTTWSRCAPRPRVGSTRCCASSSPAVHPGVCRLIGPPSCCAASSPRVAVAIERKRLAVELLADVRRLDRDLAASSSASPTPSTRRARPLLELHGVGPIVAAYHPRPRR